MQSANKKGSNVKGINAFSVIGLIKSDQGKMWVSGNIYL